KWDKDKADEPAAAAEPLPFWARVVIGIERAWEQLRSQALKDGTPDAAARGQASGARGSGSVPVPATAPQRTSPDARQPASESEVPAPGNVPATTTAASSVRDVPRARGEVTDAAIEAFDHEGISIRSDARTFSPVVRDREPSRLSGPLATSLIATSAAVIA